MHGLANGGVVNWTEQAQGSQANNGMFGKNGEVVMNEIKVNIQDQITNEINNQINSQDQQTTNDERNYSCNYSLSLSLCLFSLNFLIV